MKQQYDEPFFLTKTEFNEVVHKECPETLQRVKRCIRCSMLFRLPYR